MFDQRERIALLIDGANLFALKALGFDTDYGKLLQAFRHAPICSGPITIPRWWRNRKRPEGRAATPRIRTTRSCLGG